jgi:hypothetical protein
MPHKSPSRLDVTKVEFDAMLHEGTVKRADGTWSSTHNLVPKKDSGWRPCGDYRTLNSRNIPDKYPVPHIHDYTNRFSGCTNFSKIGLVKAYTVLSEDIQKTAITTNFVISFHVFGLRNAAQTFQRFMDEILEHLYFSFAYIDDILFFRRSP